MRPRWDRDQDSQHFENKRTFSTWWNTWWKTLAETDWWFTYGGLFKLSKYVETSQVLDSFWPRLRFLPCGWIPKRTPSHGLGHVLKSWELHAYLVFILFLELEFFRIFLKQDYIYFDKSISFLSLSRKNFSNFLYSFWPLGLLTQRPLICWSSICGFQPTGSRLTKQLFLHNLHSFFSYAST